MSRCGLRYSALFHLILVLSLLVVSCAPTTSTPIIPPASEENNSPIPAETTSPEVTLYRGDPQRTGVFDIRAGPCIPALAMAYSM